MTTPGFDNAFTMLQALLQQWGLESLNDVVKDMLVKGDSEDVIPLKLRQTDQYKARFAGNIERQKKGLPVLSEAEYLSTETALKNVVRRYVGSGTYDTQDNLTKWLGADLSPQELNDRLTSYQRQYAAQPQEVKDAWAAHGLTPADAIKAIMDPSVTEGALKRQGTIYALGSQAVQAYRDDTALNMDRLGQLADAGVTDSDESRQAFQAVAGRYGIEDRYARSQGETLSRTDQENEALLNDQAARQKREKILNTEKSQYAENYLAGPSSLGRQTAGSY